MAISQGKGHAKFLKFQGGTLRKKIDQKNCWKARLEGWTQKKLEEARKDKLGGAPFDKGNFVGGSRGKGKGGCDSTRNGEALVQRSEPVDVRRTWKGRLKISRRKRGCGEGGGGLGVGGN